MEQKCSLLSDCHPEQPSEQPFFAQRSPAQRSPAQRRPAMKERERPDGVLDSNLIIPRQLLRNRIANLVLRNPLPQPGKPQINHRRGVEREQLTENQTTDDRDAQRSPQLRA